MPAAATARVADNATVLSLASTRNPGLAALSHEVAAGQYDVALAKLQYTPDFSVSANTNLTGVTQNLMGMVTLPLFRHEAIDAAVRQAEANIKASEAMRRQAGYDLSARLVSELSAARDADRQRRVLEESILPRANQMVATARTSYETGQATLPDLLDAHRSLVAIRRLLVNLKASGQKSWLQIEALIGQSLEE
jgi:outer membrane protein TolC